MKNGIWVFVGGCFIALCGLVFFVGVMKLTDFKNWADTDVFWPSSITISAVTVLILALGAKLVLISMDVDERNKAYASALETLGGQPQCDLRLRQWAVEVQKRNQMGIVDLNLEQHNWDQAVRSLHKIGYRASPVMLHYLSSPSEQEEKISSGWSGHPEN